MMCSASDRVRKMLALGAILLQATLPAVATQSPEKNATAAPKFKSVTDFAGMETFTIMDIQGTEMFSPLKGVVVATSGVVTLHTANRRGFWIQDPEGDDNPNTSDGIYVLLGRQPQVAIPAIGDFVKIIARVDEAQRGIELPHTLLREVTRIDILESDRPLPPAIPLTKLPDTEIADAIAFWEPLEGMRVSLEVGLVVDPTNRFGEFVVVSEANAVPGSGFYADNHVLKVRSLGQGRVDYNPERIMVDDNVLDEPIEVLPGNTLRSLVGVVDYSFSNYKVQAASYEVTTGNPPQVPVSVRSGAPGNVRIVNYNLQKLFDLTDNPDRFDENFDPGSGRLGTPTPEELERRLNKHVLAITQELNLPHILVSQEFESRELFQEIGDRVNAIAGTRYMAVSLETSDRRGLEVGFLFDQARVELVEYFQMSGPDVERAFGIHSEFFRAREPLVGTFRFSPEGPPVTLIANKFKSKRVDAPLLNVNARPIRVTEKQRKVQARVVRDFVNKRLHEDPKALVMVIGDLGDLPFAEPGEGDHAIGILEGGPGEVPLTNLLTLEDPAEAYTYLFQGNAQVLSHILVSPALRKRCVAMDILHFNSPWSWKLRFDENSPLRASDRDPLEARFEF